MFAPAWLPPRPHLGHRRSEVPWDHGTALAFTALHVSHVTQRF